MGNFLEDVHLHLAGCAVILLLAGCGLGLLAGWVWDMLSISVVWGG